MIYIYIFVMAAVTYLIRMLPLTLFQKKIENRWVKSFLYYVPYACLMAMTFPAVFYTTSSPWSAIAAVLVGALFALRNKGLMMVAVSAAVAVFVMEKVLLILM